VSGALVSDKTIPGATSVLRGERYRFEVTPAFGTLQYVSVLADYRKYITPVPFYTIAARVLHVGKYGSGAGDPRVSPLYLGHPSLVRGYGLSPQIAEACAQATVGCDGVDRLLGSRAAVGNIELRFPVLRPLGVSSRMHGPVPMEVAFFADGGLIWRTDRAASQMTASAASSAGITIRANVLGLGLGRFDIARPFTSAGRWSFRFTLAPAL